MVWPIGHGISYGIVYVVWSGEHVMAWPCGHHMVYGMAWRASRAIVWPGGHRMVLWYGLVGLAWDMVWQW